MNSTICNNEVKKKKNWLFAGKHFLSTLPPDDLWTLGQGQKVCFLKENKMVITLIINRDVLLLLNPH